MNSLEWPLGLIDRLVAALLAVMLIAITFVLFTNATARYFAGIAITGGAEGARCLMIWMTFLGSYLLVRVGGHVVIDLFGNFLPPAPRRILQSAIAILGACVFAYVAWLGFDLTTRIFATGQKMSSLPLARAWFYLPIPIGFGLMTLASIQMLLATWTGIAQPKAEDFGPPQTVTGVVADPSAQNGRT